MSKTKRAWEASMERGWDDPGKFVCMDCVEDDYLRDAVASSDHDRRACDYCDADTAAPVSAILEPIGEALHQYFGEPAVVGVPLDEDEWVETPMRTGEALMSLPLFCNDDLFQDVETAIHNTEWVARNRYRPTKHDGDHLTQAWEYFEEVAKHRTRYFFGLDDNLPTSDAPWITYPGPVSLLGAVGQAAEDLGLVYALDSEHPVYRARHAKKDEVFETFDELGPPPQGIASAGRMNPAGISYLYLAKERATAVGEVASRPPCRIAVGTFQLKQDILVLDLTEVPQPPSVFDVDNYARRQSILFLDEFVRSISAPVEKDGQEHIEFVPSQVVSEFFAQVFSLRANENGIEGMVYPSTVVPHGQNLVVFPPKRWVKWSDIVDLVCTEHLTITDWLQLKEAVQA